jgi:uncharacterized sulfatase
VLLATLLVFGSVTTAAAEPLVQPNFVLIIGDDVGWPHYGFMGHPVIQTPHLDALAAEGTWFPVAYAAASLCRPSNPAISTGLHNFQMSVAQGVLDHATPTFASELKKRGYATFAGGKWPVFPGEEHATAMGFDVIAPEGKHTFGRDALTSQSFRTFLAGLGGQPFTAWLAPYTTHVPFSPLPQFRAIYEPLGLRTREESYFGTLTQLDAFVGLVRQWLTDEGQLDHTVIFYMSDNGQQLRKAKSEQTENGMRSPLILWCGPTVLGCTNQGRRDELVHFVDVFPTILALAGAPLPDVYDYMGLRLDLLGSAPWRTSLPGQFARQLGEARARRHLRTADGFLYVEKSCRSLPRVFDLNANPLDPPRLRVFEIDPTRVAAWRAELDAWWNPCGG